jgi:glycosyltransferase involved in cell wall biosynthesis
MVLTFEVLVSVIVCTRNRAHYLPACLESLARQHGDVSFEVLIVDNGSADDTPQILDEWCRTDSRFRATREPRVGLSTAKNAGVRLARGRLLLFTDDDVIVDRNWVGAYVDFFRSRPHDLVIGGGPIIPIPADLGHWPDWFDSWALPDCALLDFREERPLGPHEYIWGANMAIPAGHFERFGRWDEAVGRSGDKRGTFEDTEYQDRIRARGGTVWFCPSAKLHHRMSRADIAPSRILRNAYSRGRNEFWKGVVLKKEQRSFSVRGDYARCLGVLLKNLGVLAFWAFAFRLRPSRPGFERAHAAAWSSGSAMDLLRAGRETSCLSMSIGHSSLFILDSILWVVRSGKKAGG